MTQGRGFIPNHSSQIQSSLGLCPNPKAFKGSSARSAFSPGRGVSTDGPLESQREGKREQSTGNLQGGDRREDYTTRSAPSPAVIPRPNLFKLLSNSNPSCTEASLH